MGIRIHNDKQAQLELELGLCGWVDEWEINLSLSQIDKFSALIIVVGDTLYDQMQSFLELA